MEQKAPKVRNRIGRNIYETHCIGARYDPDKRKSVPFTEVIEGNINSLKRAQNILTKRFPRDTQFIVEELHHFVTYVSAPIEEFMKIVDQRTESEID